MGMLDGRSAVVTGGGRGIGRALAVKFAEQGANVLVTDLDGDVAEETAALVRDAGRTGIAVAADVSAADEVQEVIDRAIADLGGVQILANVAGIVRAAMLHKMTEEEWDSVLDTHAKGTWNCIRAAYPTMREQEYGRIINVTSAAGLIGTIGQINYGAAKGAIAAITKSAALEMARFNVTSNAISPGTTVTRMTETIRQDERFSQRYLERIPLGRWATPEDIANAALFFASDLSAYVTGQILQVDGGMLMR